MLHQRGYAILHLVTKLKLALLQQQKDLMMSWFSVTKVSKGLLSPMWRVRSGDRGVPTSFFYSVHSLSFLRGRACCMPCPADYLRRHGRRDKVSVSFCAPGEKIFGIPR